jgi:hypothetical protein
MLIISFNLIFLSNLKEKKIANKIIVVVEHELILPKDDDNNSQTLSY